ncbi:DUF1501 domain-containing protein [Methylomonas sp. AM2-LC]|uniref:DUF1501 domain-containing protein n=1 Tax=Methylomonas sp. AM2-LC TaxID=3153301 RepID=UPI0032660682
MNHSRRNFLKTSGCALSAGLLLPSFSTWGSTIASGVSGTSSYQAMVCIFLYGGNDGNNMVIPYDRYADYNRIRGTSAQLNIPQSSLLKIQAASQGNQTFGLHPNMPELQNLYHAGNLAVLCNTGPLIEPITRTQYLDKIGLPDQLYSHADQQREWQSATTYSDDPLAATGWGGRSADDLADTALSSGLPIMLTFAGNDTFTQGVKTHPFAPGNHLAGFPNPMSGSSRYQALHNILNESGTPTLTAAANKLLSTAINYSLIYNNAMTPEPTLKTVFPKTDLGNQLLSVAKTIAERKTLAGQKQIFFVSLGGFDTHTGQLATQARLLQEVSQAMHAFYQATVELSVANEVVAFTMSDFARTLQPNTDGGSDHAWGNHHLIMGGSVKGGDFYGKFPTLKLGGTDDTSSEGRWIPSTSVDQYAATLTAWFGLNNAQLLANFPNLRNFSIQNLDFMHPV